MTINEIAKENYKHAIRRGKINDKTSFLNFIFALDAESDELYRSGLKKDFDPSEAVDVIFVTMSLLEHNGYNVEAEIMKKLKINQERE